MFRRKRGGTAAWAVFCLSFLGKSGFVLTTAHTLKSQAFLCLRVYIFPSVWHLFLYMDPVNTAWFKRSSCLRMQKRQAEDGGQGAFLPNHQNSNCWFLSGCEEEINVQVACSLTFYYECLSFDFWTFKLLYGRSIWVTFTIWEFKMCIFHLLHTHPKRKCRMWTESHLPTKDIHDYEIPRLIVQYIDLVRTWPLFTIEWGNIWRWRRQVWLAWRGLA